MFLSATLPPAAEGCPHVLLELSLRDFLLPSAPLGFLSSLLPEALQAFSLSLSLHPPTRVGLRTGPEPCSWAGMAN